MSFCRLGKFTCRDGTTRAFGIEADEASRENKPLPLRLDEGVRLDDVSEEDDGAVPQVGHDSIVMLCADDGLLLELTAVATEEVAEPVGESGGQVELRLLADTATDSFEVDGAQWT